MGRSGAPQVILVVEDEHLIRIAIADFLHECGFTILEACNGDEAIELLRTRKSGIDLVFSDVQMPGTIDGMALASWVRVHRPEIRVILTSGVIQTAELATELCDLGPIEPKPYHQQPLLERIRTLLSDRDS